MNGEMIGRGMAQQTMQDVKDGDPWGLRRNALKPGEVDAKAHKMVYDEDFKVQLESLRAKVYNGEPLTDKETDIVTYLHGVVNQGKLNPLTEEPTFGGQMSDQMGQMGNNIREYGKGKYDELLTSGQSTIDDIAGQAEQGLESLGSMFGGQTTEQLDVPARQPSGDLQGVLEEMRGDFPFERDVNNMAPSVPFNEEAVMTPERKQEWQEYMMQLMMRGNQ